MSIELKYLALTVLMTSLFWIPYVMDRIRVRGLISAMGNPSVVSEPTSGWAARMNNAHRNAIENLVLFAPLVIIVHVAQLNSSLTATATVIYFYARIAHFIIYSLGIPYLRTLAFAIGLGAQLVLALVILGLV